MKSIATIKDFLTTSDRQEIYYWAMNPPKAHGSLVILHGLGEHSGRYKNFAKFLAKKGWAVYLYDQRGHGRTPGLRSYVESFDTLIEDLDQFIHFVRSQNKNRKPFLLGHSFGGQVAINYLARYGKNIEGAVLSSPNIQLAMRVPFLKRFFGKWISRVLPSLSIPNDIKAEWISHDKQVVEEYEKDQLIQHKITLRLGNEILENLENIFDLAPKIKMPVFFFHGSADKVTCPKGTEKFFNSIPSKDRELKIYPDFYHETLNEKGKEKVFADVVDWLEERAS